MKAALVVLIVVGVIAFRMAFPGPAWYILPKSWQRWMFGRSYSPFRNKSSH